MVDQADAVDESRDMGVEGTALVLDCVRASRAAGVAPIELALEPGRWGVGDMIGERCAALAAGVRGVAETGREMAAELLRDDPS